MSGMTAAHNDVRCHVSTSPDIPPLSWSNTLASAAQQWANQMASENCANPRHSGNGYGENIAWGTGSYTPAFIVGLWVNNEVPCFTYGTFPGCCSCTCGHYTQVVWRSTTDVGCAMVDCPGGGEFWICNYSPPGNYMGQYPY